MRGRWMAGAIATIGLVVGPFAVPAQAGQANGHDVETVECEGLGTLEISVQPSEDNWGSVQIIGTNGHLTPVSFTFTLEDLTKGTVVFSETDAKGGNAHRNQELTDCSLTFTGTFEEIAEPGEEIPPGVDPEDILMVTVSVEVVAKA
jgi:hypothetical protein